MNLQVPSPHDSGELCDFDILPDYNVSSILLLLQKKRHTRADVSDPQKCRMVTELLDSLPSVREMRRFLRKRENAGGRRRSLKEMDEHVLPAAWQILRWLVFCCSLYQY